MKFYRWITLGALFGCSVVAFAQTQDVRTLDIVIRDFQPNHPDFENFSEESVDHINEIYNYVTPTGAALNLYGYDAVWYSSSNYHNTCGNMNTFTKYGVGARISRPIYRLFLLVLSWSMVNVPRSLLRDGRSVVTRMPRMT